MRILWSVLLLLVLLPDWSGEPRLPLLPAHGAVTASPVPLDAGAPQRRRIGALTYLGGVQLQGPRPAFGGFSALRVDGDRFTLVSDGGNVVQFSMGDDWVPRAVRFSELPAGPGRGWHKRERDSESMTHDPATGRTWIGFERANQIWRYAPGLARAEGHGAPAAMANWPSNGGAESLVRLRDGTFLVLAEDRRGRRRGTVRGWAFAGDPTQDSRARFGFSYRPPAGFEPTDMVELPDGRLAILNRRFRPPVRFNAALTLVPRRAIRPAAIVTGQEIARFDGTVIRENFEALAVSRSGDDTILWIASDDNQWGLQRSLLLKFRLDGRPRIDGRR